MQPQIQPLPPLHQLQPQQQQQYLQFPPQYLIQQPQPQQVNFSSFMQPQIQPLPPLHQLQPQQLLQQQYLQLQQQFQLQQPQQQQQQLLQSNFSETQYQGCTALSLAAVGYSILLQSCVLLLEHSCPTPPPPPIFYLFLKIRGGYSFL